MSDRKVTIVVFGHVGNGKSTLCNTLIGDNTGKSFKESANPQEETKETIGKSGSFDGVTVVAIDTPGYGGSEKKTAKYIVDMANYIKQNAEVQAYIIVLNYQNPRLDEDLCNFFELITGMYHSNTWLDHLAVVWTRYYPEYTNVEEKNARKNVPLEGIKRFMPTVTADKLNSIPQYFVDSIKARSPGEARTELAHMLAWASTNQPMKGVMRVKKGNPIIEKRSREVLGDRYTICTGVGGHEFGFFGHRSHSYEERQKVTTIFEERERQEYTSGDPTFTEWHQVRSETRERTVRSWTT